MKTKGEINYYWIGKQKYIIKFNQKVKESKPGKDGLYYCKPWKWQGERTAEGNYQL